jgi:hypothetical protein
MRNDDGQHRVRQVVGRMADTLSSGRTIAGPLEAELVSACRRAVLEDIRALSAKLARYAREHLGNVLKRSARSSTH